MSRISTHVLDVVLGKPAGGIALRLEKRQAEGTTGASAIWSEVASGSTDDDGRCRALIEGAAEGTYRLTFETGAYLKLNGRRTIYPEIVVVFACGPGEHYHLPLLLSDNAYTTYRGS